MKIVYIFRAFLLNLGYFVVEMGEKCNGKEKSCIKMQAGDGFQFLCASHPKPQDVLFN
jgi:hypothetical protein